MPASRAVQQDDISPGSLRAWAVAIRPKTLWIAAIPVAVGTSLAWMHAARFLTTASRLSELPATGLPEIAFVGRSNAGKSTAINALARHRRLAFASRTPGRTQHINLFALGPKDAPDALVADLPGYGYAGVARDAKRRWQQVMADYLARLRDSDSPKHFLHE